MAAAPRDAAAATVKFDISWENSWRHGSFHDAAWVFFKVRADDKSGFGFNIVVYDDDEGTGIRHWLPLAPGMAPGLPRGGVPASVPTISGKTAQYPRLVLEK